MFHRNRIEFGRLKSMKLLALNNNSIRTLEFLSGHGKLEKVCLNDNKINSIPQLYGLISLKHLSLK